MSWSYEIEVKAWVGGAVIGQDSDGDIGLIDGDGYSIIIDAGEAAKLRDWLNEFIERRMKWQLTRVHSWTQFREQDQK